MTLLALETSTSIASAALLEGDSLRASIAFRARQDVCRRLLPRIQAMMEEAGVQVEALRAIAVGRGPGSFTGIRIGVALAKGLALALDLPLFGISTLAACAYPALGLGGLVCSLIPAHGDEVYAGIFRVQGQLSPVQEGVWPVAELLRRIAGLSNRVTFVAADAQVRRLVAPQAALLDHAFLPHEVAWHLAAWVGRLAQARLEAGDPGDGVALAPVYLRPSQAEMQAPIGSDASGAGEVSQ